ncbi:MAG: hypothetical protein AVDCRST_MAG86-759 [uncultured Truepera sp.]|uniref:Uncharacterized protein n=1 Tax=uncultured Truepera sp. TaxID=543023 RepID=A0A6J4UXJ4_9DEIN|nr:MAG: hypothetical protein AVDCRST_MAG86-759 [uncultured Truepera sp.]
MNIPKQRKRPSSLNLTFTSYGLLRRRGLLHAPFRPGLLLRARGTRLVHPSYRRGRPSDTGG